MSGNVTNVSTAVAWNSNITMKQIKDNMLFTVMDYLSQLTRTQTKTNSPGGSRKDD